MGESIELENQLKDFNINALNTRPDSDDSKWVEQIPSIDGSNQFCVFFHILIKFTSPSQLKII